MLTACAGLPLCRVAAPQAADFEHHTFTIGQINYFGYGGLSLDAVRAAMPWHVGDSLTPATFSRQPVIDAITAAIGKPPTDVNVTCCIEQGKLTIFIGLPGTTSHVVPAAVAPSSDIRLDATGLDLYRKESNALAAAAAKGDLGEDDSRGYAVSKNQELGDVNRAMRAYAVHRGPQLARVLRTSNDVGSRRAASALLGYAQSSVAQRRALTAAVGDPDEEVRNNVVRALNVLAAGKQHVQLDATPLIQLLYSGKWTDRNKASLLLMRLTDTNDPQLLQALRRSALPALVEGARWQGDLGHSLPFLDILGSIAGLSDAQIHDRIAAGETESIVSAATAAAAK